MLTNMHLKKCSRKVVFLPVGDNVVKMSKCFKTEVVIKGPQHRRDVDD